MIDRELLELAAKAAGFEINVAKGGGCWINDGSRIWPKWNPLTDNGNALSLAVALKLDIAIGDTVQVSWVDSTSFVQWVEEPYPEVRRAIVRAAAEIGIGKSLS